VAVVREGSEGYGAAAVNVTPIRHDEDL